MKLRQLLPFEKYILSTPLSAAEVLKRIDSCAEPKRSFSFSLKGPGYTKPYSGTGSGTDFTLNRNINYRNSFLPVINGHVAATTNGSEVYITMRLPVFTLVFILFWLGTVGLVCIGALVAAVVNIGNMPQSWFSPVVLIPFGMFVFGWILTTGGFKYESRNSRQFLNSCWRVPKKKYRWWNANCFAVLFASAKPTW